MLHCRSFTQFELTSVCSGFVPTAFLCKHRWGGWVKCSFASLCLTVLVDTLHQGSLPLASFQKHSSYCSWNSPDFCDRSSDFKAACFCMSSVLKSGYACDILIIYDKPGIFKELGPIQCRNNVGQQVCIELTTVLHRPLLLQCIITIISDDILPKLSLSELFLLSKHMRGNARWHRENNYPFWQQLMMFYYSRLAN